MAAGLSTRAHAAWSRPDSRPIYEWAAQYAELPTSYALPGKFDVSVNRPLMAVFDAIKNPFVRRVRFRKPPRFGGSLINDLAIPWIVCNDPGTLLWNWQKQDAAAEHMKEKVWPLWNSIAPFKVMLPRGNRYDVTNTEVYFGPFFLKVQGANPNNLQGKGIRWLFNEEIWLPVWKDLYNQAVSRTRDFARTQCEKVVDVSQAGLAGGIEDQNFRQGDQSIWSYKAPNGQFYPLVMYGKRPDGTKYGLVWSDDAKRKDGSVSLSRAIETARYVCKETGREWSDTNETRAEWNRDGCYVPQNTDAPKEIRSFSAPALLNNTFADLISRKLAALEMAESGNMAGLRDVKMQDDGEAWSEEYVSVTIAPTANAYKVADHEDGAPIPDEKYRTLMADRQRGFSGDTPHRWCEVRAWRGNGSSRQLYFGRVDTKEAMRELQAKYKVPDRCVWQDARWETHRVYEECVEYGWIAVFGSSSAVTSWVHELPDPVNRNNRIKVRWPFSPWQQTTVGGKTVFYLLFNSDYCKDILANLIAGRGVTHEHPIDVLPAYLDHLKAEHRIQKGGRMAWEAITSTKANHGWDTSTQGIAFALLMKLLAMPKRVEDRAA